MSLALLILGKIIFLNPVCSDSFIPSFRPSVSLSNKIQQTSNLFLSSLTAVVLIGYPSPCTAIAGIPRLQVKHRASFKEEQTHTLLPVLGNLVHKLITDLS